MITVKHNFKVYDNVFYYPLTTDDDSILKDQTRMILGRISDYKSLIGRSDIMVVYPWGAPKKDVLALLKLSTQKRILFINCGENIYGAYSLLFHFYFLMKKAGLSVATTERVLFSKFLLSVLSLPSLIQPNNFVKKIYHENNSDYFFWLTNKLPTANPNVFFAPYFFFFSQRVDCLVLRKFFIKNNSLRVRRV